VAGWRQSNPLAVQRRQRPPAQPPVARCLLLCLLPLPPPPFFLVSTPRGVGADGSASSQSSYSDASKDEAIYDAGPLPFAGCSALSSNTCQVRSSFFCCFLCYILNTIIIIYCFKVRDSPNENPHVEVRKGESKVWQPNTFQSPAHSWPCIRANCCSCTGRWMRQVFTLNIGKTSRKIRLFY
jgi:hypothetical protein